MKKFLFNSALLFTTLIIGYGIISFIASKAPKRSNTYLAAMEDKHKIIQSIKKPKLILAGGSNLAFGIDSEKIEHEFSVHIVNMGLHAGLGLKFITNELRKFGNEGDVVVLSIEYLLGDGSYDLKNHAQDLYLSASEFYSRDIMKDIELHMDRTRKQLKRMNKERSLDTSSTVYSRKSFNKYGDVIAHLEKKSPKEINGRRTFEYQYWEGIDILNDFNKHAKSKNINVFFVFPCYPRLEYEKNKIAITALQNDILRHLSMEVLSTPEDFVFDDSLFFDTNYHLNKEGREIRTKKIIEVIEKNTNARQSVYAIRTQKNIQSL